MRRTILTRLLFLTIAGLAALAAPSASMTAQDTPGAKGLDVSEYTLDNGLRLLVVNRPGVPLVASYVWYRVGAADEVGSRTGVAHFLEHMMFKGSRNYKKGEIDAITQRNGGVNNAFTSSDFTAYYFVLPKSRYLEALKIEADRMRDLSLDSAEFDAEKQVVQSESDRSADNPSNQLWERMETRLFGPGHPYAHPTLGWPQDVQDISRRYMREFYDTYYHPNNATLVLSGDIKGDEALAAVKELFGKIPRGPDLMRTTSISTSFTGPQTIEHKCDSEVQRLMRFYTAVAGKTPDDYALDVASMILGSGVTSRLYRKLVDERKLADWVAAGNYSRALAGYVYLEAQLADGHKREELEAGIDETIAELAAKGVTPQELERVKNQVIAQAVFQRESADDLASDLGRNQTAFGDWRLALSYVDKVREVSAEDVKRAVAKYLVPRGCITGWLVPRLTPPSNAGNVADAKPTPLDVKRTVLANGVTVLMLQRPGLPVVSVEASVRCGRATDPADKPGLASFTGDLLTSGTSRHSKQQLAEIVDNLGANLSVGTSGGSLHILSQHAATGLDLLADCMQNPAFPEDEVELVRGQTLAAIEASKEDAADFCGQASTAWLFHGSALGHPGVGTRASVSAFKRADLVAWHKLWFEPNNTVLAVVGDFKAEEMLELVKKTFGAWKALMPTGDMPKVESENRADLKGMQRFSFDSFDYTKVDPKAKRIVIDHPNKDQVIVELQCIGIKRNNPDYYALTVLDNIMGTAPGFTDRFSRKLRDDMGLAYSTYANIARSSGYYPGAFVGYIGTKPQFVEKAIKVMYELIDEIRNKPVTAQELRDAKDYLKGNFVLSIETSSQIASLLVDIERQNLGFDYLVKFNEQIEAVTAADIMRVAQRYLEPQTMVEVLCGPIDKITKAEEGPDEPPK